MTPLILDAITARRFMRRALGLDDALANAAAALSHHGYIQIDPINVCGRMHDLILRNRIRDYREGDLLRLLHGDRVAHPAEKRVAFEHHLPTEHTLAALPLDAWPHLQAAMRRRRYGSGAWSGRLSARQKELAERALAEIAQRGPLSSDDFAHSGRARAVWGTATQAKATLQKLFFHGRVLISYRSGTNRRYYDLPERVLPEAVFRLPEPSRRETQRWTALLKLRQRRLTTLKRAEYASIEDLVQPVAVEGCPPLYLLRTDLPLLDAARSPGSSPLRGPLLLAPLDPLIYSRPVTRALWNYEYTWEVYVPAARRVRGYYALPILAGTDLVGHLDCKADRPARRLRVMRRSVRRGYRAADALRELARWLGLK